jgi:uncharacterized membrane protein (DUF373 family)
MHSKSKFDGGIVSANKVIIRFLMALLTVCLVLSSADLTYRLWKDIISPPVMLIDVKALFDTFHLILTIAVGYELVKSLHTIVTSDSAFPSLPLVQIAIIAVSNKIITVDIHHSDYLQLLGLAAVMVALGITYFFLRSRPGGGL